MTERTFVDEAGARWRVWAVRPALTERRAGRDRRVSVRLVAYAGRERRSGRDRREASGSVGTATRGAFLPGFEGGWLCFESGDVRRRLAPVPPDWASRGEHELRALLARALPARRARSA